MQRSSVLRHGPRERRARRGRSGTGDERSRAAGPRGRRRAAGEEERGARPASSESGPCRRGREGRRRPTTNDERQATSLSLGAPGRATRERGSGSRGEAGARRRLIELPRGPADAARRRRLSSPQSSPAEQQRPPGGMPGEEEVFSRALSAGCRVCGRTPGCRRRCLRARRGFSRSESGAETPRPHCPVPSRTPFVLELGRSADRHLSYSLSLLIRVSSRARRQEPVVCTQYREILYHEM